MFATPRALALSYVDPYVDYTGRLTGYVVVDLRRLGDYDWRLADTNVWKLERLLLNEPHRPIRSSNARIAKLRERFKAFKKQFPDRKPFAFRGRENWTALPAEFWYAD